MKNNVFIKSAFRKPLKVILIFLIIALMSFGFTMRAVEFIIVNKEINRLSDYYKPVGQLVSEDSENTKGAILNNQSREFLESHKDVEFLNIQRNFCGMMENIITPSRDPWMPMDIVYYYGKVVYLDIHEDDRKPYFLDENQKCRYDCMIYVVPDKVEIGFPENIPLNEQLIIHWYVDDKEILDNVLKEIEVGHRYFFKNKVNYYIKEQNRYVQYYLEKLDSADYIYHADTQDVQITDDILLKDMELREIQKHALIVNTTKDMSLSPKFNQNYYLTNGRLLNQKDDEKRTKGCVVRNEFAEENHLKIGDTLKLDILSNANPKYYLTHKEYWPQTESLEVELEIVGTYTSQELEGTNFFCDDIFVPDSIIPSHWGTERPVNLDSTYFLTKSPENAVHFEQSTEKKFEKENLKVMFVENGWENFKTASIPMKQSTEINLWVFGFIFIITLLVASASFYIVFKKTWLILRLIGLSQKTASRQLFITFAVFGGIGVLLGSIFSWRFAINKANETLSILNTTDVMLQDASLSIYILIVLCLINVSLWMINSSIIIRYFSKGTLLDKTHINPKKDKKRILHKTEVLSYGENTEKVVPKSTVTSINTVYQYNIPEVSPIKTSFYIRYICHHFLRTKSRNIIIIFIFCVFVASLGWIQKSIENNENKMDTLYATTVVEGKIVPSAGSTFVDTGSYIYSGIVDFLVNSGYATNFTLEAAVSTIIEGNENDEIISTETYGVQNIPNYRYFNDGTVDITYAEGYDETIFNMSDTASYEQKSVIILSDYIMKQLDLELNDTVKCIFIQDVKNLSVQRSRKLKIIGTYPYEGGSYIYAPMAALKDFIGNSNLYYTRAEFEIKQDKNREVSKFRELISETAQLPENQYMAKISCLIKDEELTQAIEPLQKNVELMHILYPIIILIAVSVTALGNAFIVLMSEKETAVMRILGTTKRSVRMMVAVEQIILNIIGMLIGIFIVTIVLQNTGGIVIKKTILCALLCVVSGIISVIVTVMVITRKRPLDLLSMKE